jgi:hypothetical protein
MRTELWILVITGFFIYNAYHDNKYTKLFMRGRKYYTMLFYGALGIGIYLMLKRDPTQAKNMLMYANNAVKYMPINKTALNMFNPVVDFTTTYQDGDPNANMTGSFMKSFNNANNLSEQRILGSGKKTTKRSVSETKKKYVASNQNWTCGDCNHQLTAWFEVDHIQRLEHGGSNEVSNLVALCRECHGKKTAMENM